MGKKENKDSFENAIKHAVANGAIKEADKPGAGVFIIKDKMYKRTDSPLSKGYKRELKAILSMPNDGKIRTNDELRKAWKRAREKGNEYYDNKSGKKKDKDVVKYVATKNGMFRDVHGDVSMPKVGAAIAGIGGLGLLGYTAYKNYKANKEKEEEQDRIRKQIMMQQGYPMAASEANMNEMRGNNSDIYFGTDSVAIAGNGAAEVLVNTMGEYAQYAEDEKVVALGVDSLRAAQITKLENGEQFSESEPVKLEYCIYSVGDEVEVTDEIHGKVVEVLPLPESFCDSTMVEQVMLDNGVLANVTENGNLWVEMSEDGSVVTTPIVKYNSFEIDGEEFSGVDLGLIAEENSQLAEFSIEDYIPGSADETNESFSEENEEANADTNTEADNAQFSESYLAGKELAAKGNFSEAELVSYSRSNNYDLTDFLSGYSDTVDSMAANAGAATEFHSDLEDVEGIEKAGNMMFSEQNEFTGQKAQAVNFSEESYNTNLDEISSWIGNPNL